MDTEEVRGLLRHLVATIAYRGGLALRDAPAGFGAFSAGAGMRTPGELVRHLTGLMYFAQSLLSGGDRPEVPALDWEAQIDGSRRRCTPWTPHWRRCRAGRPIPARPCRGRWPTP